MLEPQGGVNGTRFRVAATESKGVRIVPVILCGGSATGLWPLSRESLPTQLWPLISDRTMLQETALRGHGALKDVGVFAPPIVMCGQQHRFMVAAQLQAAGIQDARIVLEPCERNTAPAIAAAALLAIEEDPDAILWVMPADSVVTDVTSLRSVLGPAVTAAGLGRIVCFGVDKGVAAGRYGAIHIGPQCLEVAGVFDVERFREARQGGPADRVSGSEKGLLNCGILLASAGVMLEELQIHQPEVLRDVTAAVMQRRHDLDFIRLDPEAFARCLDVSVAQVIPACTTRNAVVPVDIGWSDVANWDSVWSISPKDVHGNVALGDVILAEATDCYVRSDGIITAVVGLSDAAIVVTKDAVLAMHRDRVAAMKGVVQRLRSYGRKEAVAHHRSHRPWGYYDTLVLQDRFQVKQIMVDPGRKLSLQKHLHRAEHWVIVGGSALVTRDDEKMLLQEGESVHLPLGCTHRIENPGRIPLWLIEVQVGPYLGEDDIVRIEDDYARC
ncbi:mannose-1-phosphate guanylyltransferase/mannose-6-phosphate isomerase [Dankookia sp. GCM10030260]|uniref:mannose-1-phosphate guanylyltransferase/mannose-6-phosphate isomerase n=1 Tax=Dankookia sp. GCM10030260 TaxID=3273390 RepID=UPI00362094AC